ncbi:hypothetical protein FRC01_000571, partial [Tulasnella sp. 417]
MHDVNFIHTSDIHSWYLGHRPGQSEWDADIGDVVTFVQYLKNIGAPRGQDVIFVDTGDQTHGGGLSDADRPEGAQALLLHTSLPYDVLSPGNHELEKEPVARHLFQMLEAHPEIKEKYLAANVFYQPPNEPGAERRQLGSTHRIWHTESGRKVTAIGAMFENENKTRNAGVYIEKVESIVTQKWFTEKVLTSNPDVFILAGHMSLADNKERSKWRFIYRAIRDEYPHTPIFIFAGHTHVRDCFMGMNYENPVRSLGIESGRYLETVGWVGADLTPPEEPLKLARIHLEASRQKFIELTGANATVFDRASDKVMRPFHELASRFGLNKYIGCLDNDYPWDDTEYSANNTLHAFNLYRNVAFPYAVPPKDFEPYVLLLNNGFIRGPLYSGEFRQNDKFTNLPYDSQAFWKTRIPKMLAQKVLEKLMPKSDRSLHSDGSVLSQDNQRPMVQGRYMRGLIGDGAKGSEPEQ